MNRLRLFYHIIIIIIIIIIIYLLFDFFKDNMRKLIYVPTRVDEIYSNIHDLKKKMGDFSAEPGIIYNLIIIIIIII